MGMGSRRLIRNPLAELAILGGTTEKDPFLTRRPERRSRIVRQIRINPETIQDASFILALTEKGFSVEEGAEEVDIILCPHTEILFAGSREQLDERKSSLDMKKEMIGIVIGGGTETGDKDSGECFWSEDVMDVARLLWKMQCSCCSGGKKRKIKQ